jgi:carboxylesterase
VELNEEASEGAGQGDRQTFDTRATLAFLVELMLQRWAPAEPDPNPVKAFLGGEHVSFTLPGGRPGALLVHGFLGTPAEMRPLGESLRAAGWTSHGLLLPGFGAQIAELGEQQYGDWQAAVGHALDDLRREHSPVLVVGYSMGAALAISAVAAHPADGLVLLAPFWWGDSRVQRGIGVLLRPLLPPHFRPFRQADFSNPQIRRVIEEFFPELDPEDPAAQEELRRITIPVSVLDALVTTGKAAYREAADVGVPVLVVQGRGDPTVPSKQTRRLLERFDGRLHYLEVDGGHEFIRPLDPAWPKVRRSVIEFAASLLRGDGREG